MRTVRLLLITGLLCAATAVNAQAPANRPVLPSQPFTVDGVVEQQSKLYPNVSKPSAATPRGVAAREDVVYARPGGRELALDIYRPARPGALPAVLVVHGGGWESGSRQMERPFAKALAARGFVAVPVTYSLGEHSRWPQPLHDLKSAVRWLRNHAADYGINPDRIGVVGGSAGGHLAAMLGASNGAAPLEGSGGSAGVSSAVQAVVDIDGAVSFPDAALIAQEMQRQGATSRFLGGDYAARREVWFEASPLTWVTAESAPTLFINSTAARPVLPGRREMKDRLRALGIDSDLIVMADTPHPFWLVHPWFEPTVDETAGFLRKHLTR
jgi:pectinesterase